MQAEGYVMTPDRQRRLREVIMQRMDELDWPIDWVDEYQMLCGIIELNKQRPELGDPPTADVIPFNRR